MRRLPIALLILALTMAGTLAPPAASAQDQDGPAQPDRQLVNRIAFLLPRLASPRYRERLLTIRELQTVPVEADPVLLRHLKTADPRIGIELADVVAARQIEGGAEAILDLLPRVDRVHDGRILNALRACGDAGWQAICHRLFQDGAAADGRQPRLERLYEDIVRAEVVDLFRIRISNGGRTGYHRDMYSPAFRFGSRLSVQVFCEIARADNGLLNSLTPEVADYARQHAVRALGDFGKAAVREGKPGLESAKAGLHSLLEFFEARVGTGNSQNNAIIKTCYDYARYALYKLGEKEHAEDEITNMRRTAMRSNGSSAVDAWSRLAHLYLQVDEYELALEAFTNSIDHVNRGASDPNGSTGNSWYNIACIHSRLNRPAQALQAIRAATQNGFADWDWMFRDGDLDVLWNYEGFKKWIAELRKDEAYRNLLPKWEPGNPPEDNLEEPQEDEDDPFGEDQGEDH